MSFDNSCVLITGASRGIGYALVQHFAAKGAFIIATASTPQSCELLQTLLKEQQIKAAVLPVNLTDKVSVQGFLTELKARNDQIDILINNAGITRDTLFLRMKDDDWDDVLATNLTGAFKISQYVLRGMLKRDYGRVISISSVVGVTGNPGQANYCASKAGLIGMSKALAQEVASRGITVNVIAPGFVETDMTKVLSEEQRLTLLNKIPSKKLGVAKDIAHACSFLASREAHYITGHTLHINGGLYMN
jgi:3-oxoacyl-[acyl-carrier protein] reductase